MDLAMLSDQELMESLRLVCADSRRLLVRLLLHLNEVEARRLDAKAACPSLYEFCVRRLGMSDGEACRRIAAARLVRRFPSLIPRIESGGLNLTALHLLRDAFTESNVEELAAAASGKTKREVEELLARRAPKPDVAASIVALPAPARVLPTMETAPTARVAPLSEDRYEVRFTADRALRDKIEHAKELLRHRHPGGDLEAIMHRAYDALLVQLKKERLAASDRPQRNPKPTRTGHIPRAVRREVFARDGEQCTFVDAEGNRCSERGHLELDHVHAKALGGAATAANLRVLCRSHNRLHAEVVFGEDHVATKIREHQRQRGCDPKLEAAERALKNLGFGLTEARRALTQISCSRAANPSPPLEVLLREAIAVLT